MRVIIVDDDFIICECLKRMIDWNRIGCSELLCAHNGEDAWKMICTNPPNIVISDVRMPVMGGKELSRMVYERYPDISFFMISAYEDFSAAQAAIRYNVKGYILKPFDKKALCTLEDMIYESCVLKHNSLFYQNICSDQYRESLSNAIEQKNEIMIQSFFDKLEELLSNSASDVNSIWLHLILPMLDYYNRMKINHASIYEFENKLLKDIMELPMSERAKWLCEQYMSIMQRGGSNKEYLIKKVKKIIEDQLSNPDLDIGTLAQMTNVSSVYLGRIFYEQMNVKIIDYIQDKRIQFACRELVEGNAKVKQIALMSGYPNVEYFNKIFKKKMNITPTEYRKKYRGNVN